MGISPYIRLILTIAILIYLVFIKTLFKLLLNKRKCYGTGTFKLKNKQKLTKSGFSFLTLFDIFFTPNILSKIRPNQILRLYSTVDWQFGQIGTGTYGSRVQPYFKPVLRSRSRKDPHLLAGAVTRCGSGSDGSGSDNGIKHG
jgi:hypothetical protein